jgi:putative hydrolase of the HAD superfamily
MKAVLFDLGRVLVHYDHVRTLSSVASVCNAGAGVPHLMREQPEALQIGGMECDELHAYFVERAGATPSLERFCEAFCAGLARDERALAYAVQLEQREELLVGVLSNTNSIHVRWLDENVPELRTFDLVMMSSEVGLQKPDPAIYRLALELLDVRPEDALFIDDLAENVAAAQALGMAGIVHRSWEETPALLEEWLRGR